MSRINRRYFLQSVTTALAILGIDHFLFSKKIERYGKVLAENTPRKLALLVGINEYASNPLEGCLNDLDLQRNLLIHRFNFNPKDILVVKNAEATRQGILTAFEEHLIKQAKPGDVVVYHYSGHGSLILDPNPIVPIPNSTDGLSGTFVPVNSQLPVDYPKKGGVVEDIMGHTLFLLMSALKTENVSVVLDSCFAGGATKAATVRSRNGGKNILVSANEKSYQQQWLSRLNLSPEQFIESYRTGIAKGVVLAATSPNQLAREENISGITCGIFTYLLTYFFWQENSNIQQIFSKISPEIPKNYKQEPGYEMKPGTDYQKKPLYFINDATSPAQAVVMQISGDNAQVWLGGVDLTKVTMGSVFTAVDGIGKIKIIARNGFVGQAQIEQDVKTGTLLRLR